MNYYILLIDELSLKIKIASSSLIYRKCLNLNLSSLSKCTTGLVVTLITKDVVQFDKALDLGLLIITGVFQIILMTYMMYEKIGISALIGVGLLILLLPFQGKIDIIKLYFYFFFNNMVAFYVSYMGM